MSSTSTNELPPPLGDGLVAVFGARQRFSSVVVSCEPLPCRRFLVGVASAARGQRREAEAPFNGSDRDLREESVQREVEGDRVEVHVEFDLGHLHPNGSLLG